MAKKMNQKIADKEDALDKLLCAKELIYEAQDAPTSRKAMKLAEEALATSPDCADAICFWTDNTELPQAIRILLLEKAVEAGRREIELEFSWKECAGAFWGILETRPFMRAKGSLARELWLAGRRDESIAHHQEMLTLNPNDNQGMRYDLVGHLIQQEQHEAAQKLLAQYSDDETAWMVYPRALLEFITHGATKTAEDLLNQAITANPHIPDYLLGNKKIPPEAEAITSYVQGSEDEALCFVGGFADCWLSNKEALRWLKEKTAKS